MMDEKYQEDNYEELEHKDIPKRPHPDLEYKQEFPKSNVDPYVLNSYGFDEGSTPFHTVKHQHMDIEFHIESHILDTLENIRKNVKGKEDMSVTQNNSIVMDRLDVLEKNLKTHVTEAKNEIKTHTTNEINSAETNIKNHVTTSSNNVVSSVNTTVNNARDNIKSHVTSENNSLWSKISNSISNAVSTLSNLINSI